MLFCPKISELKLNLESIPLAMTNLGYEKSES